METQPKLTSSKEVIAFLAQMFPQCFCVAGEARPLKIGIFRDLVERVHGQGNISKTQLRNALRQYTSSWRYLYGIKSGAMRVDLDGNACGELDEQHIAHARQQLEEAKARVAQIRSQRAKAAKSADGAKPARSGKNITAESATTPAAKRQSESVQSCDLKNDSTRNDSTRNEGTKNHNSRNHSSRNYGTRNQSRQQTQAQHKSPQQRKHPQQQESSASATSPQTSAAGQALTQTDKSQADKSPTVRSSTASPQTTKPQPIKSQPAQPARQSAAKSAVPASATAEKKIAGAGQVKKPLAATQPGTITDISTLRTGQQVTIRIGSNETSATVQKVAKEGVRVQLASGMSMIVRAEHVVY